MDKFSIFVYNAAFASTQYKPFYYRSTYALISLFGNAVMLKCLHTDIFSNFFVSGVAKRKEMLSSSKILKIIVTCIIFKKFIGK